MSNEKMSVVLVHGAWADGSSWFDLASARCLRYCVCAAGIDAVAAPTGFRIAVQHPERITAIISQNGNALAAWGKNDPFFLPPGAEAFKRDIPEAGVQFFDTGHFALATHAQEIAVAIRDFLAR